MTGKELWLLWQADTPFVVCWDNLSQKHRDRWNLLAEKLRIRELQDVQALYKSVCVRIDLQAENTRLRADVTAFSEMLRDNCPAMANQAVSSKLNWFQRCLARIGRRLR